jgi:tetratricopeptide (TPR) repeat protein
MFNSTNIKRWGGSALVLLLVVSFFYGYQKRYSIYFVVGNTMFGGKIFNHTFYNIGLAKYFLNKANEETPTSGEEGPAEYVNYQLSRINFIQGNLIDAIYFADRELHLHPENCRTYYIRGLTYGYMERFDKAAEDFEIFNTACVFNSWAGHNDLAWFYFQQGDIKKMRSTIEKVITIYTTNPWIQNTYGLALLNSDEYEKAKEAFLRAKSAADAMTEKDWGRAYPGNNPRIYGKGLAAMRSTIEENLRITEEKLKNERRK